WSPDGRRIAFAVDRTRIEVVDEAGARAAGPVVAPSADRMNLVELHSPSFTPDGADIAFAVIGNGMAELRTSRGALVAGED
ncbi:TolB family protein, partial [Priestia megaterium]|uniref:TolB family protein n=1 Tax=Priestia megaterium TaxID=1404 RepID=UPI0035B69543